MINTSFVLVFLMNVIGCIYIDTLVEFIEMFYFLLCVVVYVCVCVCVCVCVVWVGAHAYV